MYIHREREKERVPVPSKTVLVQKRLNHVVDRSSPSTSKPINGANDSSAANKASRSASNHSNSFNEESETDSDESDVSGSGEDDTSWISWFCNLRGNEFFCEVDDDYIRDDFNLSGLSTQVPYYDYALDLILDVVSSHGDTFREERNELIESAAKMLYGLMHARFILTSKGMAAMLDKYRNYDFGRCPRLYCNGQPCLPVDPTKWEHHALGCLLLVVKQFANMVLLTTCKEFNLNHGHLFLHTPCNMQLVIHFLQVLSFTCARNSVSFKFNEESA
ncbi:hypothetical protein TanjilG_00932 [Lupinus angustifolius]|uniref:Casein kinase II subunit beta n=1 Tax=Lupinus angustifolius TaxID=3871 RepID=A0A4P1QQY6_LUPAN|nr:hypothetical protein TanjilG_00932 [Lupinus angustifolius]